MKPGGDGEGSLMSTEVRSAIHTLEEAFVGHVNARKSRHEGGTTMNHTSNATITAILVALSSLFLASCGGAADAPIQTPASPRETEAIEAPASPTATATKVPSDSTNLNLEGLETVVLSAAPGYTAEEPSEDDWAATEEEFAALFGEELEQYAVMKFDGEGTVIVEMAGLSGNKPQSHLEYIRTLQEGGGREYADSFLTVFQEEGISVTTSEDLAEASALGEAGWGFTAQLEGGGISVDSAEGNVPDEIVEFADQPVTMLIFVRSNLTFKVTVLLDPDVNALAIARALDNAVVEGSDG